MRHPEQKPARPCNIAAQLDKSRLLQAGTACHNNKRICGVNQAGWHSLQRHYDLEQAGTACRRGTTHVPEEGRRHATVDEGHRHAAAEVHEGGESEGGANGDEGHAAGDAEVHEGGDEEGADGNEGHAAAEVHEGGDEGAEGNEGHAAAEIQQGDDEGNEGHADAEIHEGYEGPSAGAAEAAGAAEGHDDDDVWGGCDLGDDVGPPGGGVACNV